MIEAGPVLTELPGDHLRNAVSDSRSSDRFSDAIAALLRPISISHRWRDTAPGDEAPEQGANRDLSAAVSLYAVGGMLTAWSCVIPRPRGAHLVDLISPDELAELYSAAETWFCHTPQLTGNDPVDMVIRERLTDAGYEVEPLPLAAAVSPARGGLRYTGAAQILGDAAPSIKLLPEHICRELRWSDDGNRAMIESALVLDIPRRRQLTIAADAFVVTCNSILTPQLLFTSGIWRDRLPALGRFLTEHPKFFGQVRIASKRAQQLADRDSRAEVSCADVPAPTLMIPADVDRGRPWHGQITCDPLPAADRAAELDRHSPVQLRWFAPCEPRRENEVRYSRSAVDALGMPQPIFDFSLSRHDRRVVAAMIRDCEEVAALLGGFLPGLEGRMQPHGHSSHAAGTFRMGTDPETSVCDSASRVWGFGNLFLGGNGVIPNAHAVNPTLTAAALAIRGARALGSTLGSASEAPVRDH